MLAKYPKELRFKWYLWVEKHQHTVRETCQLFGIQRKIYYYWYAKDHSLVSNQYVPRKPHPHLKLTSNVKIFIEKEKLKTNYGPLKMSLFLKRKLGISISPSLIYRYYQKKKLIRKPQKKLPWYEPMKTKLTVSQPGEGVQADIKCIYGEDGKRQYQFSFLDVYTKKYYLEIFNTKESKNSILAHHNAEKYFNFEILSVQTDNGSEFRGDYHTWLTKNKITHYFIPKSSPNWNPQVERVHKTIDDEYYQNPYRIWKNPYEWLRFYNFERIHLTLNGLTPQEKLQEFDFAKKVIPQYLESVTIKC